MAFTLFFLTPHFFFFFLPKSETSPLEKISEEEASGKLFSSGEALVEIVVLRPQLLSLLLNPPSPTPEAQGTPVAY